MSIPNTVAPQQSCKPLNHCKNKERKMKSKQRKKLLTLKIKTE
jgi:hypothetical protein